MNYLPDLSLPLLSLPQLLSRLVAALIVIGVLGGSAAWWAGRLGDPGPTYDGRRTLNPLAHLDLLGLVHALFFRVVWMPRLDVDPSKLRAHAWSAFLLTVASSAILAALSALLIALRSAVPSTLSGSAALTVISLMNVTADFAIVTAVAHLLPVPPFLGAVWAPWAPARRSTWNGSAVRWTAVGLVAVASLTGSTDRMATAVSQAWRALLGF